jgi:hypothetical protein
MQVPKLHISAISEILVNNDCGGNGNDSSDISRIGEEYGTECTDIPLLHIEWNHSSIIIPCIMNTRFMSFCHNEMC